MNDNIVERFRKRRADRMAVYAFKKRRDARIKSRMDAEDKSTGEGEERREDPKNNGNTRLPYGLCKKNGIDLPKGATPYDAWQALKGKGINPPWGGGEGGEKAKEQLPNYKEGESPKEGVAQPKNGIETPTESAEAPSTEHPKSVGIPEEELENAVAEGVAEEIGSENKLGKSLEQAENVPHSELVETLKNAPVGTVIGNDDVSLTKIEGGWKNNKGGSGYSDYDMASAAKSFCYNGKPLTMQGKTEVEETKITDLSEALAKADELTHKDMTELLKNAPIGTVLWTGDDSITKKDNGKWEDEIGNVFDNEAMADIAADFVFEDNPLTIKEKAEPEENEKPLYKMTEPEIIDKLNAFPVGTVLEAGGGQFKYQKKRERYVEV